ncbi:MAG TPA: TonB family protein [Thermoanaerobaculia bacterium]|nr:TonB family protein [Thermoanaerobaculia bacterium]
MNIPEEFGNYLLLKKLTEDPLGETFRAGKVGKEGMEQVVLLRVFNGKGMDGEALWQKVSGRAAVQQALRSPNIGSGADLGKVRSFPYAAYDYISGKNLATVLAQADRQGSPVPTDHALLIAERLALALAAAAETRVQDERVLHGFVAPHLVMISNEGETRLVGFEVAPGLRALTAGGWNDEALKPYLAPEALAGAPISKADDVWSLGAILYELLTGERLPATAPAGGFGALIDGAMLANDGTPLPAAVAALLKKSLAPADQRVGDAVSWHKALSKLMIDGHYSPTTFNLAFFMHSLFRDEIERENREIEAERRMDVPQRVAAPVPVPAAAPAPIQDFRESTGVRQGTLPGVQAPVAAQAARSKAPLFIGIAAATLIAVGAGAWVVLSGSGGKETQAAAAANTVPSAVPMNAAAQPAVMPGAMDPAAAGPAAPAGPSPEEIQAQIQAMFEARSQEMEAKLKTQYDDRIKQLQQQLQDSKRAAAEPVRQPERPALVTPPEPSPTPAEPKPTLRQEPAAAAPVIPSPNLSAGSQQPAAGTQQEAARTTASQPPAPVTTAPATQAPAPRQVQTGDLVSAGSPGSVAPKIRVLPDPRYPTAAQKMKRSAEVAVRVLVDESGRVLDAERVGNKAGMGFDEAAVEAARRASFQPATKDGVRVKMWTTVRIKFTP